MGELLGAAEDDTLDEELELAILQGSKRAMKRYQFGAVRGRPRMPVAVQGSSRRASRWVANVVVSPSWTTPVLFENRTQQPAILATSANLDKLLEEFISLEADLFLDAGGSSTARAASSKPVLRRKVKSDGRGGVWLRKRLASPRANKYEQFNFVEASRHIKAPDDEVCDLPIALSQGSNTDSSQGLASSQGSPCKKKFRRQMSAFFRSPTTPKFRWGSSSQSLGSDLADEASPPAKASSHD